MQSQVFWCSACGDEYRRKAGDLPGCPYCARRRSINSLRRDLRDLSQTPRNGSNNRRYR